MNSTYTNQPYYTYGADQAYYPQSQGPYNPPPPSYGQPQFTGPYNPPPPAYGQPTFTGPYDQQQAPTVIVQQPAQPQYVVVEERRDTGLSGSECCCIALCAFCCGLCLSN